MLKQFLKDVKPEGTDLHIGGAKHVDLLSGEGVEEYIEANKTKELYFLGGVKKEKGKKRANDNDIISKSYVYFDFDVYVEMEKKFEVKFTPDEIKEYANNSIEKIEEAGFTDWKYLVYSGGGFHLYFMCDDFEVDKEKYSIGYDVIAKQISEIIGLPHDTNCRNIARIARLPMSYNNKKRWDKPVQAVFLKFKDTKSDMLEKIHKLGEIEQKKIEKAEVERQNDQDKKQYGDNPAYEAILNLQVQQEVVDHFGWRVEGSKNFMTETGKPSASFISDNYDNMLMPSGSREFNGRSEKAYTTFSFIKHMKNLTPEDTFKYFEGKYPIIKAIADEARREWAKNNKPNQKKEVKLEFVSWTEMLEMGEKETQEADPKDIYSYGYNFLDEKLGGMFASELILIGGITNTGKTTLALKIGEKLALSGKKVVVVALEERLKTRARKATLYEVNRRRIAKRMKKIRMVDFLTGKEKAHEFERQEAIQSIKNDRMEYVQCDDQLNIDDIEEVFKRGADLYVFDHLHYFGGMNKSDKSKADSIEESMQIIKKLTKKYDARTILIAHFTKIDESKKPTMTNFKDSISIAQTADTVIMLWRDKSIHTEDLDQYHTHFIIPKNRVDEPSVTIEADFDINTNEYKENNVIEKNGTENSYDLQKQVQKEFII